MTGKMASEGIEEPILENLFITDENAIDTQLRKSKDVIFNNYSTIVLYVITKFQSWELIQ